VARRDEAGFEAFVSARSDDLLRFAVLLVSDRGHAEDLLQSSLVKVYRRWHRIEGDPYPYARRALVNAAASWRRLHSTQEIVDLPLRETPVPDPTEELAERARMTAALATLPPRMRAVLVLRFGEDLGEAATAEALGVSVATVNTQTSRGLARLRALLGTSATAALLEEC
jgi:RNA polymerase sigma-70 factor (sigma-E family)